MANVFDQFDAPAQGGGGNVFDQFDAPPPTPPSAPRMDIPTMALPQLMEAYRTLPRDNPMREAVKQRIMELNTGPQMTGTQSFVAGATDALSLGLSDEINGGISMLGGGDYNTELAAQRQMMKSAEADNPGAYMGGELAGSLVQGLATGGAGTFAKTARAIPAATRLARIGQAAGRVGRAATEAAATGAVYGFNSGEGGFGNRLQNAAVTGAESAAFAPAAAGLAKVGGKIYNKVRGQTEIWSPKELTDMSQRLYRQANQIGATIKPNTLANVGKHMVASVTGDIRYSPNLPSPNAREAVDLVDRVFVQRGPSNAHGTFNLNSEARGVTPHGGTTPRSPEAAQFHGTANEINGGRPTSLEEIELVRGRLGELAAKAAKSGDKDEARMIYGMRDRLDSTLGSMSPADMANGSPEAFTALGQARKLWNIKSNTNWVNKMGRNAHNRAGQLFISAKENSLRTVARQAANNDSRMARVGPEVQKAVEKVANPGVIPNTIRKVAKFAPGGAASTIITALKPVVGFPLMGAGLAAQVATNRITNKNWRALQRAVQRGVRAKPIPHPVGEKITRRAVPFAIPGLLGRGQGGSITAEPTRYDENGNILN